MKLSVTKAAAGFGAAVVMLGVALIVIHVPIRTTLLFGGIGFGLVCAWLYVDAKENSDKKVKLTNELRARCSCQVCHHDNVNTCLNIGRCPCCCEEVDGKITGHRTSGLQ